MLFAQETIPAIPLQAAQQPAPEPPITGQLPLATTFTIPAASLPEKLLLPQGRVIELFTLEPISTATATAGATIQLAVARDLTIGGVTILRQGTPVTGTVSKISRGVAGEKQAQLEIHVSEIALGQNLKLSLDANWKRTHRQKANSAGYWILAAPFAVLAAPILLAGVLEDKSNSSKPTGEDIIYPACTSRAYYIASDTMISVRNLDVTAAGTPVAITSLCPKAYPKRCGTPSARVACTSPPAASALNALPPAASSAPVAAPVPTPVPEPVPAAIKPQ